MVEGFRGSGFRVPLMVAVRVPSRVALRGSYAKSMRIRLFGVYRVCWLDVTLSGQRHHHHQHHATPATATTSATIL